MAAIPSIAAFPSIPDIPSASPSAMAFSIVGIVTGANKGIGLAIGIDSRELVKSRR
jgi:hypothetical protein